MGIRGIKTLIKKFAPEAFETTTLNLLRGKTICIDSSIFLYKFRYTYKTDNFHILGFLNLINKFNEYNIKCIFVFDGKPPQAKSETLKQRREKKEKIKERIVVLKNLVHGPEFINSDSDEEFNVDEENLKRLEHIQRLERTVITITRQHSIEVIELLKSIGTPFLVANSEAEKACVYLQKHGYADFILTEDTDCMTFGGHSVIFAKANTYTICHLNKILEGLNLSQTQFIDLCILCGCDYTTTIPKVGPATALKYIKRYGLIENIPDLPPEFDYQLARDLFTVEEEYTLNFELVKNRQVFSEICQQWNIDKKYFNFNFSEFLI
jgi:flap endonuclease-1